MKSRLRLFMLAGLIACAVIAPLSGTVSASDANRQGEIERIGPEETRALVASGDALLICSYDDKRCESILLEGALLRSDLETRISELPKDQALIFYCS